MSARLSQAYAREAAVSTLWAPLSVTAQLDTSSVRTVPSVKVGNGEEDLHVLWTAQVPNEEEEVAMGCCELGSDLCLSTQT